MNSGDTAWVLISAALVLFMTPGLALFYGGMVRSKGVLSVMMQSFICMGLVTVLWAIAAFSLSFGDDAGAGIIGNLDQAGLGNLGHALPGFAHAHLGVSPLAVMVFQMMFAVITAALISGGSVDRIRFQSFVVFIVAWLFLVYVPRALGLQPGRVVGPTRRARLRGRHRRRDQLRVLHAGPGPGLGPEKGMAP